MEDLAVRFGILGPVRAWRGADELNLGAGKQRSVLAVLLLEANRPVAPGRIVSAVWRDDPPANGTNVVQKYVAGLRQVLEPDRVPRSSGRLLTRTDAGYRLSVAPGCLDADDFRDQVLRAHDLRSGGRLDVAASTLEAAFRLWHAEPLAGLDGPVFDTARERLREARATALEAWAELELELGRHSTLLPELTRLVAEFPLRERLRYLHMLALYRCGRQAEALAAYRDVRALLVDEIGVEPGEALQRLQQRILQADSTLLAGSANGSVGPAVAHPAPAPESPAQAPPAGTDPAAETSLGPAGRPAARAVPLAAGRRERWRVPIGLALTVVPVLSIGMATWLAVAVLAAIRRRRLLWLAAAAYLVCMAAGLVFVDDTEPYADPASDAIFTTALIVTIFVGTAHVAWLAFGRPAHRTSRRKRAADRDRRRAAREFAEQHPAAARELGVGRPDLQQRYPDGGLVDLNEAPAHVLVTLPGVTAELATLIVSDRERRGRFSKVDDLTDRGILAGPVPDGLRDLLVVIP